MRSAALIFPALQRSLLAFALSFAALLYGCGTDPVASQTEELDTDDESSDDAVDEDLEQDDDVTASRDAGRADAGRTPGRDAGPGTKDSGEGSDADEDAGATPDRDAGDDTPRDGGDAGKPGPSTPSGGGLIRGETPTEASASRAGPYMVKRYTSGYRNGPAYADSTIHHPEGAEPPFASIAIVPGFVSPQASIQSWGPFLASHGIVTMTIGTNSGSDPPAVRSRALLDALETLRSENTRNGSPLFGKLDTSRMATGGWSMGGGGTLLAAESTPTLKATLAMCAWNPGYRYAKLQVPTLMFAGTADPLAGGQSQGFYQSIPEATPKMLFEFRGAGHNVANNPSGQGGVVGRYGLSFLKVFLEGDERYREILKIKGPGSSDFRSNI